VKHLRNGFYFGILLLILLAACGPATSTPVVLGPVGLAPTSTPTTVSLAPLGLAPTSTPLLLVLGPLGLAPTSTVRHCLRAFHLRRVLTTFKLFVASWPKGVCMLGQPLMYLAAPLTVEAFVI